MSWLPALVCALLVGGSLGRFIHPRHSEVALQSQPVKYVITGEKGADGHWTEQVKMEHGEEDWHIEVDHMTLKVGEGQPKVKITATFSAKSKTQDVAVVPDEDSSESGRGGADDEDTPVFQLFPLSHLDWFGAKRRCEEWGGHLAIPDSRAKMRELTRMLRKHVDDVGESTGAFLGFDDLKREGEFVTVLGKPLFGSQDSTWSPRWFKAGQPDNDMSWTKDGEDCGSFRPNGGLNDVPCRYNLPFICEKAAVETVAVPEKAVDDEEGATDEVAAPDNVEDEHSHLKLFLHPYMDWHQAKTACMEWGGHLAIPSTGAKMLKMREMLTISTIGSEAVSAFVDYNEMSEKEESFTLGNPVPESSDSSMLSSWTHETQSEENDKHWTIRPEYCGVVHIVGGIVNRVPCLDRLPYFCEKSWGVATSEDLAKQLSVDDDDKQPPRDDSPEGDAPILFARDDLDWFDANDFCRELSGGHLAIPDSVEKMESMTAKMKLANVPAAFLGFSDQKEEGHFVTIFGTPVFSDSSSWSPRWWREDQPDDDKSWFADGEDCGSVKVGGGLNDVPCRHHMPFFCERASPDVSQHTASDAATTTQVDDDHPSQSAPLDGEIYTPSSEVLTSSEERMVLHHINSVKDIADLVHAFGAQLSAQSSEEEESSKENNISQVIYDQSMIDLAAGHDYQ